MTRSSSPFSCRLGAVLALCAVSFAQPIAVLAQSSPPPIDPALRARFGFRGPGLKKIGDSISLLTTVDLDQDGTDELMVFDRQRGRFDVLRVAADGSIVDQPVDARGQVADFVVADFDGDGELSMFVYEPSGRLTERTISGERVARPPIEVGPPGAADSLHSADLDGDGRPDLVAWTRDGLRVVRRAGEQPIVSPALSFGSERPQRLLLDDFDGDGKTDLVLLTREARRPIRFAAGDGRGGFGSQILLASEPVRNLFPGPMRDGRRTLGAIRGLRGRFAETLVDAVDSGEPRVRRYSLPESKDRQLPFTRGDFDGDGDLDLVVAHGERAELYFYEESDAGFVERVVPTLSGVTSLAAGDVDGDGRDDLLIASPEEKSAAIWYGDWPKTRFAERFFAEGEPSTVAFGPSGEVLVVTVEKRNARLVTLRPQDGRKFTADEESIDLGRLRGTPGRVLVGEIDEKPGADLAFVESSGGLKVLSGNGEGGFTAPPEKGEELFSRLADGELAAAPDGGLLVARPRYARRITIGADGRAVVATQWPAPAGAGSIDLIAPTGSGALLLVDRSTGKLFRQSGVGSAPRVVDLPGFPATHVFAQGDDAIVMGPDGFVRIAFGQGLGLRDLALHEPPTDDTAYAFGTTADLDGDGRQETVLVDHDLHGLQILTPTDSGLERCLAFPVFDAIEGYGTGQPREIAVGDFDGDGRQDLALLAFDRILLYFQER